MAHKTISDEELLMLLSPIPDQQDNEKPKLTMKLLYELIKKLKQENVELSERIAEYELKLDKLQQGREEVASTLEHTFLAEPENTKLPVVIDPPLPQTFLLPRSERHPARRKQLIGTLFMKAVMKLFIGRRRGSASRYRSLF